MRTAGASCSWLVLDPLEHGLELLASPLPKAAISVSLPTLMRRWWPETLLVVLALAAFLGCLGSVELWGKREQRAAAEAIDTVDHDHWLVAEIQGRPRLEKPPLPRWSIAALMKLTGCRDERVVRLPGAVAGALTIALIYAPGIANGRPRARAGVRPGPLLVGVLRRRDAPGQQRWSARALHDAGALCGLAKARAEASESPC